MTCCVYNTVVSAGDEKQWHASVRASVSSLASKHSRGSSSSDHNRQQPSDKMHTQSNTPADCIAHVPAATIEHDPSCLTAAPATESDSSQAVVLQSDGTGLSPLDDALLQLVLQTLSESSLDQVQEHQHRQQRQQQQLQQEAIERQLALQLLAQSSLQQMHSHATLEQNRPSADVSVSEAAEQLLASLDEAAPSSLSAQQSVHQVGVGASEAHEALLATLAQTALVGLDQEHQQQHAQQMLLQQQQEVYQQQQCLLEQQSAVHDALLQQQRWEQAQQQQQVYCEQQKLIQQQQVMLDALQQAQQQQQQKQLQQQLQQQQCATAGRLTEPVACPQEQLPYQVLKTQTSAQTTASDPPSPPPLHPQAAILPAPAAAAAAAVEEVTAVAAATEEAAAVAASSRSAHPADGPVAETAISTGPAGSLQSHAEASSACARQATSQGLEASKCISLSLPPQLATSPQQAPASHAQLARQQSTANPDHGHLLPTVTAGPVSFNPFQLQPGAVPGSLPQAYYLVPAAAFPGAETPMVPPTLLSPLPAQSVFHMPTAALPAQSSALAQQSPHLPWEQQQKKKSQGTMNVLTSLEDGNLADAASKPFRALASLMVASQQQEGMLQDSPSQIDQESE